MAKKKKTHKLSLIIFLALIFFSFASIALLNITNFEEYLVADVLQVNGYTVILGNNCTAIVAETSPERAHSIETGMKGIIEQRPDTYDIFAQTLKSFNITLEYVTLDNFENNTYYANLFLRSGNKFLKLDVKPSDGIALAIRTNSTIYINKTLLSEQGQNIC